MRLIRPRQMALGVVALIGVEAAQPAVARRVDGGVGGGIAEAPHEKLVLQAATPMLSVQDASATEGSPVQFTVTLDRGGSTEQVTVDYSTSGGTATEGTDYTAATGTLTFSSGQTTHTVSVETTTDDAVEADEETFTLTLSNPTGAEIVDGAATGAIVDANNHPGGLLRRTTAVLPPEAHTPSRDGHLPHPSHRIPGIPRVRLTRDRREAPL